MIESARTKLIYLSITLCLLFVLPLAYFSAQEDVKNANLIPEKMPPGTILKYDENKVPVVIELDENAKTISEQAIKNTEISELAKQEEEFVRQFRKETEKANLPVIYIEENQEIYPGTIVIYGSDGYINKIDYSQVENITQKAPSSISLIDEGEQNFKAYYVGDETRGLACADFDTTFFMAKSFLNEYYFATLAGNSFDFAKYIANDSLLLYAVKKTGKEILPNHWPGLSISYGLTHIQWFENYVFLKIAVEVNSYVGGFGELQFLLIENKNNQLVISDWYSQRKDNLDSILRGDLRVLEDVNIWEKEEWVKQLFEKMI